MPIEYKYIDLAQLIGPVTIIHGVNCQGKMGSGVAKALYSMWPAVKHNYLLKCATDNGIPEERLGEYQLVNRAGSVFEPQIVNAFTQLNYGYDRERYACPSAIAHVLRKLAADDNVTSEWYIPRIGCGLGGLDWEADVLPDLEKIAEDYPHLKITVCDLPNTGKDL